MFNDSEFSQYLMGEPYLSAKFDPTLVYDPDGDCLEFVARDEQFKAQRLDDFVTVYYGRESNELVGSMLKGLHRLFELLPGFRGIEIRDGRVRLSHVLRASAWSSPITDEGSILVYEKLIAVAEKADAEFQLEDCSA